MSSFGNSIKYFAEKNADEFEYSNSFKEFLIENNEISTIVYELEDCIKIKDFETPVKLLNQLNEVIKNNYECFELDEDEQIEKSMIEQIISHYGKKLINIYEKNKAKRTYDKLFYGIWKGTHEISDNPGFFTRWLLKKIKKRH